MTNEYTNVHARFMRAGALCGETRTQVTLTGLPKGLWRQGQVKKTGRVLVHISVHATSHMPHMPCVYTICEKLKYWHEIQIDETPTDFRRSSRSASVRLTHHVTCPHQLDLQPAQTSSAVSRMLDSRNSTKRLSLSPRLILGGGRG